MNLNNWYTQFRTFVSTRSSLFPQSATASPTWWRPPPASSLCSTPTTASCTTTWCCARSASPTSCRSRCRSASSSTRAPRPTTWRCGWRARTPATRTSSPWTSAYCWLPGSGCATSCFLTHPALPLPRSAYHGHLSSLIEISPYKFNMVRGHKLAEWVHVVRMRNGGAIPSNTMSAASQGAG